MSDGLARFARFLPRFARFARSLGIGLACVARAYSAPHFQSLRSVLVRRLRCDCATRSVHSHPHSATLHCGFRSRVLAVASFTPVPFRSLDCTRLRQSLRSFCSLVSLAHCTHLAPALASLGLFGLGRGFTAPHRRLVSLALHCALVAVPLARFARFARVRVRHCAVNCLFAPAFLPITPNKELRLIWNYDRMNKHAPNLLRAFYGVIA